MKRIAFAIQKGGTGKTTLSGNAAAALSENHRTVLVDGDPQASASTWLLEEAPTHELADVLAGSVTVSEALVQRGELSVLPTFGIGGGLQPFSDRQLEDMPYAFDDLCRSLEGLGFDIAIFDLSPGMGRLEKRILTAMNEVVTPLTPEYFSIDGIEIFVHSLGEIQRNFRTEVRHRLIVANAVNRSFRRHTAITKQFELLDFEILTVPQDSKLAEAQLYHQTIFEYAPRAKAVPGIRKLAAAIGGDHVA